MHGGVGAATVVAAPETSPDAVTSERQFALEGLQFDPQRGLAKVGDLDQIDLDWRSPPKPPIRFESQADFINAASQVQVQVAEVMAGSVAHLGSFRGPKSQNRHHTIELTGFRTAIVRWLSGQVDASSRRLPPRIP